MLYLYTTTATVRIFEKCHCEFNTALSSRLIERLETWWVGRFSFGR